MTRPEVSVLVASYQVEPYLRRCLDSVVGQTLREIEVVVVDDGSTDGSTAVAEAYARDDPRVRLVRHGRNRGPGAARNTAIEAATGRYLAFVDGDDWLRKRALELLRDRCDETGAPVALFSAVDYLEGEDRFGENPYTALRVPSRFRMGPKTLGRVSSTIWNKLYDRQLVLGSGVRFPEGLVHEDEQFHFCFFASTEPEVVTVDEPLYVYRQRAGSLMGEHRGVRGDVPVVFGNIWAFLEREDLAGRYGDLFCRVLAVQVTSILPELERDAQEPFYRGMRAVVRAVDRADATPTMPNPLPAVSEHDYVAFLQLRQRELLDLRRDPWYRLGRLSWPGRLRRAVRVALDRSGVLPLVRRLTGTAS